MDLYVVLGLAHGATEAEIKRAYRRLARRYHPDINPGDRTAELRFQQILEAYETLIDPDRRSRYDAGGAGGPGHEPARRSGFEGFDFSARGVDHSATFGDLFAEVLAERGARQPARERGADLHVDVRLSFEEALEGVERRLTVTRREKCRPCGGGGVMPATPGACGLCQGSGMMRSVRGHMVFTRGCTGCGGSGQGRPRACPSCAGAGEVARTDDLRLEVPGGVSDDERIRVAGEGNAGRRGGARGDLYALVHVDPHPLFRRDGDDLYLVVPVAVHEAALGARIEIPVPGGAARLRVPPGTQSGQRFRLRERGARSRRTGGRGDLVVEVRLMLPPVLDERSRELLREFGRINGESVREPLQAALRRGRPGEPPGTGGERYGEAG